MAGHIVISQFSIIISKFTAADFFGKLLQKKWHFPLALINYNTIRHYRLTHDTPHDFPLLVLPLTVIILQSPTTPISATHPPTSDASDSAVSRAGSVLKPKPQFSVKSNQNLSSDGGPGRYFGCARLTEDTA